MKTLRIRPLLWRATQFVVAVGWPGAAALVVLVLCAAFGFFVLKPLQDHIDTLQRDAETLRSQFKPQLRSEQKSLNPAEQLAAFYRFFPKQNTLSDWMAKLYDAAAQQSLSLEKGEYHLAHDRDAKLTRYDIVLPVKGGYLQLRKFVAQALTDVPNLSLDSITFNRQKIDDPLIDAQLTFTLYLGDE
ncbi:MAG: hypothetical protein V4568_19410 [Pseudomonadota bacterium]